MSLGIEALDLVRAKSVHPREVMEIGRVHEDGLKPLYTTVSISSYPKFHVFGDNRSNHALTILKRDKLAHRFHDIPSLAVELVDDKSIKVIVQYSSTDSASRLQLYRIDTAQMSHEWQPVVPESSKSKEYSVTLPLNKDYQRHQSLVLSDGDERIALLSFDQVTMGKRYGGEEKEKFVGLIFSPFLFVENPL